MSARTLLNLILALVVAGLVLLVIYEPGKQTPSPGSELTALDKAEITSIIIEQPQHQKIVLQKNGNGWQIQQPLSIFANNTLIENLLAIANTTSHSSYDASGVDLDQLKLTEPELTIHLNNTRLSLGNTDALRGYRYVLTNNRVHLITDRFSHLIRGKMAALVSPTLFPGNITLTKLVLPELTLQQGNDGWYAQPETKMKSVDQIQKLLDEWRYARARQVTLVNETQNQQEVVTSPVIKIHTTKNGVYQFKLINATDEMILARPDKGLRYHFDKQAGEKLLDLQTKESEPVKSQ